MAEPRTLKDAVVARLREMLPEALDALLDSTLQPRECRVIEAHLGLKSGVKTLRQIAGELGVTPEGVRQIEKRALRKLSAALLRDQRQDDWLGYCELEYANYLKRLRDHVKARREELAAQDQRRREEVQNRWPGQFPPPFSLVRQLSWWRPPPTLEMCGTPPWFKDALQLYPDLLYGDTLYLEKLAEWGTYLGVSIEHLIAYAKNERRRRWSELTFPHWRAFGFVPH